MEVLKDDTLSDVNWLQLRNTLDMFFTLLVLKLLRSREVRPTQLLNIPFKEVTSLVSKLLRSREVRALQ